MRKENTAMTRRPLKVERISARDRNFKPFQYETCSYGEVKSLRSWVRENYLNSARPSVLNEGLTRLQAYEIFFGVHIDAKPDSSTLHDLMFQNLIREFVSQRKTINDEWRTMNIAEGQSTMTRIPDNYLSTNRRDYGYPPHVAEHLFTEYKAQESRLSKVLPLLPTGAEGCTVEQWMAIQGIRETITVEPKESQ